MCSIENCGRKHYAKSFCSMHYVAFKKWGKEEMLIDHHSHASKGMVKRHNLPSYNSWADMKKRCTNKNSKSYVNYGGRGIHYEQRWDKFENFLADMGEKPDGMTLERKDVNGNYTKDNCCWATRHVQAGNKRNNVKIDGVLLKDLIENMGISVSTFYSRAHKKGLTPLELWSLEYVR